METSDIIIVVVLSIIEVALLVFLILLIRMNLLWEFKYSTPEERAAERRKKEIERNLKKSRRRYSPYKNMPGEYYLPWNQEKKEKWRREH